MPQAPSIGLVSRTRVRDWSFAWPWALGFGLTLYLGIEGGGFDTLVSGQVGIAVWWVLLAAVAIGALPRRTPGTLALVAIALLAGFVVWTGLSLIWTESTEKTALDLARVLLYLGVLALATLSRGRGHARQMAGAVGAAVVVLATLALLSRLHPAWFPGANQTGNFLLTGKERLSYPVNYWNALAALIAIGAPLVLWAASDLRSIALRSLAAAAFPILVLTALYTFSRSGSAAIVLALAVYLAVSPDRLPKLLSLAVGAAGGAVLIALAASRKALLHGHLASTAGHDQGNEMLLFTILVCLLVGLAQAALAFAGTRAERPDWTRIPRRRAQIALGVAAATLLVLALLAGAPGRVSTAWSDFKQPSTGPGKGAERLSSVAGESRYQFWSSAYREFEDKPLTGTGSNTFQLWWTRDGDSDEIVVDTHSLYMQALGELGLVGALLLLGFVGVALIGGTLRALRAEAARRPALAAALAGSTAIWVTSVFDWTWKVPVLPVASLLLLSVLLTARRAEPDDAEPQAPAPLRAIPRVATAVVALAAVVAIAIPLATTALIRQSQAAARADDLQRALDDAHSAQDVEPGAAGPRLQQALVLEKAGDLDTAATAARAAAEREPNNWRNWLVVSRIEARLGHSAAAVAAYRRAKSLNPHNRLFAQ